MTPAEEELLLLEQQMQLRLSELRQTARRRPDIAELEARELRRRLTHPQARGMRPAVAPAVRLSCPRRPPHLEVVRDGDEEIEVILQALDDRHTRIIQDLAQLQGGASPAQRVVWRETPLPELEQLLVHHRARQAVHR